MTALLAPVSSPPTASQFLLPAAVGRMAFSIGLLSILHLPVEPKRILNACGGLGLIRRPACPESSMNDFSSSPIDIKSVVSTGNVDYGAGVLTAICPVCKSTYNHLRPLSTVEGSNRETESHRRADSGVISLWGECGSQWEICTEFHKGQTMIFARLLKSCAAGND